MTLSLPKPYCLGLRRFGLFRTVVSKGSRRGSEGERLEDYFVGPGILWSSSASPLPDSLLASCQISEETLMRNSSEITFTIAFCGYSPNAFWIVFGSKQRRSVKSKRAWSFVR